MEFVTFAVEQGAGFHGANGFAGGEFGQGEAFVFEIQFWIGFAELFEARVGFARDAGDVEHQRFQLGLFGFNEAQERDVFFVAEEIVEESVTVLEDAIGRDGVGDGGGLIVALGVVAQ